MRAQQISSARVPDAGVLLAQRTCGCGGSCGPCSGEEAKKKLQRSPESDRSSRFAHDFSAVPATRAIDVRVGPAGDAFEREADRVADAVVGGGGAAPRLATARRAQRQMDDEVAEETPLFAEDEEDELGISAYDDPSGQPKLEEGASHEGGTARVPVGSGGGAPLGSSVRSMMQERIGHDFSGVRVHHDSDAARAAESVHARAFTVGSDIYFAPGRYEPSTAAGRRLLAHELTHVVQQSGGSAGALVQRAPKKKAPAKKAADKEGKKAAPKKAAPKKKPCSKKECDGKCASSSEAEVVHPWCGNETCPETSPVNTSFFIKHIDVNLTTQKAVTVWGDSKAATVVSEPFTVSPHPDHTPKGMHKIQMKCTACHTNMKGDGMAWFTGFKDYAYGFHNSQKVAIGTHSHGCVRVNCSCAKAIHDHTWSGVTTVCIHKGKNCDRPLPKAGKKSTHTFSCADLFDIAAPAPKGGGGGTTPPAEKKETKEEKKETPKKESRPPLPVSSLPPMTLDDLQEEDFA